MTGSALRRRLLSAPGLALLLTLLTVLAVAAVVTANRWSDQRTVAQAVQNAEVISDLAVRSNVDPDPRLGITTPSRLQVDDIQRDADRLHASLRLVALTVWRTDGQVLFADAGRAGRTPVLPPGAAERATSGQPWFVQEGTALAVYLPYPNSSGQGVALAEVVLPEQAQTVAIRTAKQAVRFCFLLLVAVAGGVLLVLRRRLRLRERQARRDQLTGLLSRTALFDDLASLLQSRTGSLSLLVLDLDGFKAINDTLGHASGDALLAQVGESLRNAVRHQDLVARLGGDEFAIVLRGAPADRAPDLAREVLQRLRAASFSVQGVSLAVDASIGVAVHPADGRTVQELLQHADVAMYQAKTGNLGVCAYDPATDHHDIGQLAVLVELRDALATDQLVLHYQPQIDLRTGRVVAAEALVRWQHPTRGLVMPDGFIPLAEPTGLMLPLTDWVLETAVSQAIRWRDDGTPLRVAVNVSPRSLLDVDLPDRVARALTGHGLAPAMLELEITETAVMTDPERAVGVLNRLDELGVRISIDDFGAGYSSLAYLRLLPVSALKLDRTLITHLLDRPADLAVTEALITLGHRLGLEVLAEGVETEAVRALLLNLGCDQAQGYGISRPLEQVRMSAFLSAGFAAASTGPT